MEKVTHSDLKNANIGDTFIVNSPNSDKDISMKLIDISKTSAYPLIDGNGNRSRFKKGGNITPEEDNKAPNYQETVWTFSSKDGNTSLTIHELDCQKQLNTYNLRK